MDKKRITFNYSKLRGLIREKYGSESNFSEKSSLSHSSLSAKLNNKTYFSPKDILEISKMLEIPDEKVKLYFFTVKVRFSELKQKERVR